MLNNVKQFRLHQIYISGWITGGIREVSFEMKN